MVEAFKGRAWTNLEPQTFVRRASTRWYLFTEDLDHVYIFQDQSQFCTPFTSTINDTIIRDRCHRSQAIHRIIGLNKYSETDWYQRHGRSPATCTLWRVH